MLIQFFVMSNEIPIAVKIQYFQKSRQFILQKQKTPLENNSERRFCFILCRQKRKGN